MIKIFTTNKDGQIAMTPKELKELLDEAYWDGYRKGSGTTYTYTTPNWQPYVYTTTTAGTSITLNAADMSVDTSSITDGETHADYGVGIHS